jgi:hypothetical protein
MKNNELENFEDVQDYAIELANFADYWLIEDGTTFNRSELSEENKNVFQIRLYQIINGYYNDFVNEMSPIPFIEIEKENINKVKNDDLEDYDENLGTTIISLNDFLIKNKEEICALAVLELNAIIKNNLQTYKILE